ncbi:hypothetical protein [Archaeoglobus veneficus]|uniref:Uncharacterized protein n=1 Tax=Archaeoglobus veneficus (strain DSM 11195 / SNP6) TaxID=693661 RepID=F2KNW3_ARCVS|nr:hypothetical protein [Archaeoglobus veneficus]AEA47440.1 hypothetical protein Arcve_1437 [Archaeoglobus veneficus SNP6]
MSEDIEVFCPACKKKHRFKAEIQEFRCRGKLFVLLKDRFGWRLMEVVVVSEEDD